MSLLQEIQVAILKENVDLGPVLLKLRLLAARLEIQTLADWVKYESEGYPMFVDVPDYRIISVSYQANFLGPFGASIQNAPVPSYLIEKFANETWVNFKMHESIAAVDDLIANSTEGKSIGIDASNLIPALQGNIYPSYNCSSVTGIISRSALAAIRHAVQSRVLELTIELEKSVPEASSVSLGSKEILAKQDSIIASQITNQIIYGNYTSVSTNGNDTKVAINIAERDKYALTKALTEAGISEEDAKELADLASSEEPENNAEPMGPKVKTWLIKNIKKAANGTWKTGVEIATDLITEALLKYYGLK